MNYKSVLADKDILVFVDNDDFVWEFVKNALLSSNQTYIKINSTTSLRENWTSFHKASNFIIYWENLQRNGGAIVEEILEIDPIYDVSNKIIILTTHPHHQDVIYFNELNIKKIILLRQKIDIIQKASKDLIKYLNQKFTSNPVELMWHNLQHNIDQIKQNKLELSEITNIEQKIQKISDKQKNTAKYYDILAQIYFLKQNFKQSEELWNKALDINPNYYRTYSNLIEYYIATNQLDMACNLLHKLHTLNQKGISHLVKLGEIYLKKDEQLKAEHYFKEALEKDKYCSKALNGLAIIKFKQADLEEAKKLISRSSLISQFASTLNEMGINLVKNQKYQQALDLYTKAQYVVPNRIKSSMLFYNIGLCYLKWNKNELAKKFLNLALTKESNYIKAQKLLATISSNTTNNNIK